MLARTRPVRRGRPSDTLAVRLVQRFVHRRCQAGLPPASGVFVDCALGGALVELPVAGLQRAGHLLFVAVVDGLVENLDDVLDLVFSPAVAGVTFSILTNAFFCR